MFIFISIYYKEFELFISILIKFIYNFTYYLTATTTLHIMYDIIIMINILYNRNSTYALLIITFV
jgi:hypothetical protein